ncbi:hypothetical protein [Nonomuraea sp. NPDC049028]|uniref:hypothetical protein n=1 Tax=Nonomuraea sp. NPDC049028 TaxID=3364348 RepID=UPI0037147516
MTSRTNSTNGTDGQGGGGDDGGGSPSQRALIAHAIKASRTTRQDRARMRKAIRGLDRIGQHHQPPEDPSIPPQRFVEELRRPTRARRRTIVVMVDGDRVPILLNPQGKADPDREQWLWDYVRALVREGTAR